MRQFVLVVGMLAGLVAGGCTAADPGVASVSSALESSDGPGDEDMRTLNYYCRNSCLVRVGVCYGNCSNEDEEVMCDGQCEDALANCQDMCEHIFGSGNGGGIG